MQRIADAARTMLTERLIPFWKNLRDEENGGYYGYMGFDLKVNPQAEKGCILNSRILWFFSQAAIVLGDKSLIPYARHAYEFLTGKCLDREYGGVYWSLTFEGKPLDDTKHTYNQAFAVYALSAYYQLTGDREPLELAQRLFRFIEGRCTSNGYLEAFTRSLKPASNEKLSENGVMAERTMNTLLHVFEGYSGLYHACPDLDVEQAMRRILRIYTEKVYDPERRRQRVFFDRDYNSLIDLTSYGHDIESSWLIDWGCSLLKDSILMGQISHINSELADRVLKNGFSGGSLANECENGKTDTHRVWWVQAECLLGFVNALEKHPDRQDYREAIPRLWQYITEKVEDHRPGGEWFWRLDENGIPDRQKPIVEPWKCPYHNGRMCIELIRRNPDVNV